MPLVLGHDQSVSEWATRQLGNRNIPPGCIAWGVIDKTGTLTGALLFHSFYRHGNMEIAMVGDVVRKDLLRQGARYVFKQLGCTRVTARTARRNKGYCRMLRRAGFVFEGTNKRWYGPTREDDALVFALFPDRAKRWL
jgi:RimJ/RimL family protein N-acetyltransferase